MSTETDWTAMDDSELEFHAEMGQGLAEDDSDHDWGEFNAEIEAERERREKAEADRKRREHESYLASPQASSSSLRSELKEAEAELAKYEGVTSGRGPRDVAGITSNEHRDKL
jgi:hypothetical protein